MSQNDARECPICGGVLDGHHCKLVCMNCGYREDCSDLFCPADTPQGPVAAEQPESQNGDEPAGK